MHKVFLPLCLIHFCIIPCFAASETVLSERNQFHGKTVKLTYDTGRDVEAKNFIYSLFYYNVKGELEMAEEYPQENSAYTSFMVEMIAVHYTNGKRFSVEYFCKNDSPYKCVTHYYDSSEKETGVLFEYRKPQLITNESINYDRNMDFYRNGDIYKIEYYDYYKNGTHPVKTLYFGSTATEKNAVFGKLCLGMDMESLKKNAAGTYISNFSDSNQEWLFYKDCLYDMPVEIYYHLEKDSKFLKKISIKLKEYERSAENVNAAHSDYLRVYSILTNIYEKPLDFDKNGGIKETFLENAINLSMKTVWTNANAAYILTFLTLDKTMQWYLDICTAESLFHPGI